MDFYHGGVAPPHPLIVASDFTKSLTHKSLFDDVKHSQQVQCDELNFEDKVNHPNHYKNSKFETIELIEEVVKHYDDGFVSYCIGNALKYLSRAPFKHEEPLEDTKKAAKYLEFAINHLEKENQ